MKKKIITSIVVMCLFLAVFPTAYAVSLKIEKTPLTSNVMIYNSTTYVPIRATSLLLNSSAKISWENRQAVVKTSNLTITARPGEYYMDANGRKLYIKDGVKLINGTTVVPIRALAKAFGASVTWDGATKSVYVNRGSGTITYGSGYYDDGSVYWLSRIINAESEGEALKGKIAVGNVILNRVESSEYPNSIYDVIFDKRYGVQFQPTSNGTINNYPSAESVLAAKLCLDGASVVGSSLYFLNPSRSTSYWIVNNCAYVASIGNHDFYA